MKKLVITATIVLLLMPAAGHAQFGGIVYDPTNFHNAVLRYYQLRMQLAQMQQTYAEIVSQYNLALQMARSIQNMPARYKAYFSQWRYLTTVPDVYHNTGVWVSGVNTGSLPVIEQGYQKATDPLSQYSPAAMAAMSPEELQRATAGYASVELADGTNTNSMVTIGNIRADAQALQAQIANLENDSFSSDPALNTEVGVLNKINASNVLMLRTLQDANNLRLAALEQSVIRSKQQRDADATAIDTDIYQRDHMVTAFQSVTSGLGATLQNYRLP
jgi:type IV secretion system protein TrbJ